MRLASICFVSVTSWLFLGAARGDETAAEPLDKAFLLKLADGHQGEIALGKLALRQADAAGVKDYAQTIVHDHEEALKKLAALLKTRDTAIVAGLDRDTKEQLTQLSKRTGADFDSAYLTLMINQHKKAISVVENQIKQGKEADICGYAKEILPEFRKHLQRAEELTKASK